MGVRYPDQVGGHKPGVPVVVANVTILTDFVILEMPEATRCRLSLVDPS